MLSDRYVTTRRVPVDISWKRTLDQIALILTFSSQYLGWYKSEEIATPVDILLKKETGPDYKLHLGDEPKYMKGEVIHVANS